MSVRLQPCRSRLDRASTRSGARLVREADLPDRQFRHGQGVYAFSGDEIGPGRACPAERRETPWSGHLLDDRGKMPEEPILCLFQTRCTGALSDSCVECDSAIPANQVNLAVARKSLTVLSPGLPKSRAGVLHAGPDA